MGIQAVSKRVGAYFELQPAHDSSSGRVTGETAAAGFGPHAYSQLLAFSPDNEHLLLTESADYVVHRLDDLSTMDVTVFNAPRWHPPNQDVFVHCRLFFTEIC